MTVTAVPLALSLSDTFTKVGAIVAFAAFLGIALLAMLFFAQARELKRLREWSEQEPARMAELEHRLSSAMAMRIQRATAQPARPVAQARAAAVSAAPLATQVVSEPPTERAPGPALLPAAPALIAGNIEPDLAEEKPQDDVSPDLAEALPVAAAVRARAVLSDVEVQAPAPDAPEFSPEAPELAPVAAAAPVASAAPPAAPSAPRAPIPPERPPIPPRSAPGRQGARQPPPNPSAPAANGRARRKGAGQFPPNPPARRRGGPPPGPPFLREEPSAGRGRLLLIGGAVVVVVALVAVFALGLGGSSGGGKPTGTSSGAGTSTAHGETALPAGNPSETHVVVFNGTETQGLAHHLSENLQQSGYTLAVAQSGNPPGGTYSATTVEYASGHKVDAEHVAQTLGGAPVHKLDAALAGMANGATVVVVAGTNANSNATSTSSTGGASESTGSGASGETGGGTGEASGGTGQ